MWWVLRIPGQARPIDSSPGSNSATQPGIPVVALQGRRSSDFSAVESGQGLGQLVEHPAHDATIVRVQQLRGRGGLRRLVFHIAPQLRAPQAPAQLMLGGGEGVLGCVVGAVGDRNWRCAWFRNCPQHR